MSLSITNETNPIIYFLTNKRLSVVRHILFVLVIALIYDLLTPETMRWYAKTIHVSFEAFYIGQTIDMLFSLGLIYFNLYVLFPRYFKKGLYTQYLVGVLCSGIISCLVSYSLHWIYVAYFGKNDELSHHLTITNFTQQIAFPIVFLCATTGYQVFKEWINDQSRFAALENEKLNAELNQLKNQVNPHFLFNTLNNLHVLTRTNPDKASDIILGLSDVLRYQIYDSQHDKVALTKDIEIIKQYLELEKIRREDLTVTVQVRGNIHLVLVPPLLFTNFIDNAIKHSLSREASFINILFHIADNALHFEVTNSKSIHKVKSEAAGMGLVNVQKRLALLYGTNHALTIMDDTNLFTVQLKILV